MSDVDPYTSERFASSSFVCVKLHSMNEEKTKIASYGVMFSLHMCSFIFADSQDKSMGAVSVFNNRNFSTANLTVRCCFVLVSLFIYVVDFFVIIVFY